MNTKKHPVRLSRSERSANISNTKSCKDNDYLDQTKIVYEIFCTMYGGTVRMIVEKLKQNGYNLTPSQVRKSLKYLILNRYIFYWAHPSGRTTKDICEITGCKADWYDMPMYNRKVWNPSKDLKP